jgi:hypothetical protein
VKTAGEIVLLAATPVGVTVGVFVTVSLPAAGDKTAGLGDDTTDVEEDGLAGTDIDDEGKRPLQNPPLQVLNAHCWLLLHEAWKLPQTVCSIELVA